MQNHRLWVVDGLLVGSMTLATSGLATWIKPDQISAAIAGGAISGGAITYVCYRRFNQQQSELDEQFEHYKDTIEQQLLKFQTEIKQLLESQEIECPELPENSDYLSTEPTKQLNAWLDDRGVTVTPDNSTPSPETEKALNQLALMLGKHYSSLHELYIQLKQNTKEGIPFHFSLKDRTQQDIQINTSFAAKLKQFGFLADHHYTKKVLRLQPHRQQDFRDFITGKWFERFIHENVIKILRSRKLPYECLLNRTVIFPSGDRCELDLFYWVAGQPIWIECKTGNNYDECLEEYSKRGKILSVPKSQAFMVVLEISPNYAKIRTEGWGITVTDQDTLFNALNDCLDQIAPQAKSISNTLPKVLLLSPELDLLQNVKLKLFPENRHAVWTGLVALFADPNYQAKSFKEIKLLLKERLNESNRINGFLLTLMHTGFFYESSGDPIQSVLQPIASLLSMDVESLERCLIEKHAKEVLSRDATFFDKPENIERYEQAINGKAPDAETIERLKQELNSESK